MFLSILYVFFTLCVQKSSKWYPLYLYFIWFGSSLLPILIMYDLKAINELYFSVLLEATQMQDVWVEIQKTILVESFSVPNKEIRWYNYAYLSPLIDKILIGAIIVTGIIIIIPG